MHLPGLTIPLHTAMHYIMTLSTMIAHSCWRESAHLLSPLCTLATSVLVFKDSYTVSRCGVHRGVNANYGDPLETSSCIVLLFARIRVCSDNDRSCLWVRLSLGKNPILPIDSVSSDISILQMNNPRNQTPCLVAAYLEGVCSNNSEFWDLFRIDNQFPVLNPLH